MTVNNKKRDKKLMKFFFALLIIGFVSSCGGVDGSPSSEETDDPYAALDRFAAQLQATTEVARRSSASQVPFGRGNGATGILRLLRRALDEELAAADTRHPFFQIQDAWYARLGMSNPDNLYLIARIDDDGVYRISGRRGTTADFTIQVYQGYPGSRRPMVAKGSIGLDTLHIDADGNFQIILGGTPRQKNWIELQPHSRRVVVRYTYGDWNEERAGGLRIERLAFDEIPSAPVDDTGTAARIDAASAYLYDAQAGYMRIADWFVSDLSVNSLSPIGKVSGEVQGRLTDQYTVRGRYRVRDDQALVVTTRPSKARYQGFQLGTDWFEALDFRTQITSVNAEQAKLSSDGVYRFVIRTRDPGYANWLDASSAPQGLMVLRWQGVSVLDSADQPTIEMVDFESLADSFPDDEKRVTVAERREQLDQRRLAIDRRYGLHAASK
ncbi:MAG: DUF1214 domain-containing protein [Caldilineaceae bacterium]|nr:DUF1214 domain-containing protein [Caldilineaceae bacterium]